MSNSIAAATVGGMAGIVLENEKLRAVLMPEFGARIISIIYKPTKTEFVCHNPRVPIMRPTYKPEFEDMSGFFDCVPTCENCTYKRWQLPMYGEVASESWRVVRKEKTPRSITVRLQRKCKVYPLMVSKVLTITKSQPSTELNYRLTNLSNETLEYHYSGHNTLDINPNCVLVLCAHRDRRVQKDETSHVRLGQTISWLGSEFESSSRLAFPDIVIVTGASDC
jgi:hypothetical protein